MPEKSQLPLVTYQNGVARERVWGIYDRSFYDYTKDFANLPAYGLLLNYIDTLRKRDSHIIIDLMAPPTALRNLPHKGLLRKKNSKSLSISITDPRGNVYKFFDAYRGITHLTGDLKEQSTWDAVTSWLGGKKADLVIERGYAGLKYLPEDAGFYKDSFRNIWDFTRVDGMMVLQTPEAAVLRRVGIDLSKVMDSFEKEGVTCSIATNEYKVRRGDNKYTVRNGLLLVIKNQEEYPSCLK